MSTAAQGSLILIFTTFLTLVMNYAFNVGLGWLLTPAEYGIYGTAIAIFTILTIFLMRGLPQSTAKLLSEPGYAESRKPLIFRSSLLGNVLAGVLVSGIFFILYPRFLPGDKTYLNVTLIIIGTILIIALRSIYFGALVGSFRFKARGAIEAFGELAKLLVGVGLVYLGYGILGVFGGYLAGALLALIVAAFFLRDVKFWEGGWGLERRVFTYGFSLLIAGLAIMVMQNADILGIKLLTESTLSNELAGYYQAVLVIGRLPLYITGPTTGVLFPFISRFEKKGAGAYATLSLKYTALFVLPVSIIIALQPAGLIRLLFPDTYLQSASALAILAIGTGFFCFSNVISVVFQGIGRPWVAATALTGSAVLQIVLLRVMVPQLGIVGAASSAAIAAFASFMVLGYVYWKTFGIKVKAKEILLTMVALAVLALITSFIPTSSRLLTIIGLVIVFIIYGATLPLLKLVTEKDVTIFLDGMPLRFRRLSRWVRRVVVRLNRAF